MTKLATLILICITLPTYSSNFNLDLTRGDRFITTISNSQAVIRDIGSQQTQIDNSTEMTLSFEVTDTNDSSYVVTMRYTHISLSSRGAGWAYNYDSNPSSDTSSVGSKKMNIFYQSLVGQPITIILDRQSGTIKAMSGWDKLTLNLMKKLKQGTEQDRRKLTDMLISSIKNGMMNGGPASLFPPLTGKEIRKGNQWVVQDTLSMFSGLTIQTTYHVADLLPNRVKLSISSSLSTSPAATPIVTANTKIQYKLNGTQKGTLTVNRKNGWITSAHVNQELEGTLTMIDMGIRIPVHLSGQTDIHSRPDPAMGHK